MPSRSLVASFPKSVSRRALKRMVPSDIMTSKITYSHLGQLAFFLLKVATLEAVRRFSRTRCPIVWDAIQGSQILCYPPFSWIDRWTPLRLVVRSLQKLARPLLFLSVTTALSNYSTKSKKASDIVDDLQTSSESPSEQVAPDVGYENEITEEFATESWQEEVRAELGKQGITLPERIGDDELRRFHAAAEGDYSCLYSSLKKTIRWRKTYHILSSEELETWSNLVFWHGFDVMLRPCLIIRLGVASSTLMPEDRPRFMQAVVSQVEHGVLHLMKGNDSRITVLMDCEGLSPFKFPMHMMKSGSILVQDHYPNCLGSFFVIRLPPVVEDLAQTVIQVLKPATQQKIHLEGEAYQQVLLELLHTVPAYLGGNCKCRKCDLSLVPSTEAQPVTDCFNRLLLSDTNDESDLDIYSYEHYFSGDCQHFLRIAIVVFLLLWVVIAVLTGLDDPATHSSLLS